jgi:hypothetical protein
MFKAKELTEEEIKQIRESEEGQRKLAKQFGISDRRVKVIKDAPSLEEAIKIGKSGKPSSSKPVPPSIIPPITLTGQPIMLDLGVKTVPFDRGKMYDAYQLFDDLVSRGVLKDDFASVCRDGVGLLWMILATSGPKVEEGKVKVEVTHGGSTRHGEEETGGISQSQ